MQPSSSCFHSLTSWIRARSVVSFHCGGLWHHQRQASSSASPDVLEVPSSHPKDDACQLRAHHRRTIDLHLLGDVVRLQKRRLHIHGGELPSFDTRQCHHQVLAKPWHRRWLRVQLALDDVLVLESLQDDSSMSLVLLVAQEKSHWHNGSRRAIRPLEGSPGIVLMPWNQGLALGLCEGPFLIGRQPTLHDRHHDVLFGNLHHAHFLCSRLFGLRLTIVSSRRHQSHSRSGCLCGSTCGQLMSEAIHPGVGCAHWRGSWQLELLVRRSACHGLERSHHQEQLVVHHRVCRSPRVKSSWCPDVVLPTFAWSPSGCQSCRQCGRRGLVGHHFIQMGLVSGFGFRFRFLTVGIINPEVNERLRQLGFRPSFGLVWGSWFSSSGRHGRRSSRCGRFICSWCRWFRRFMWRGLTRCVSGCSSPPELRKTVRILSLAGNVNIPHWTSHWLQSFQKSLLQRFLHALKVARLALTLVALRDSLEAQLLPCGSHQWAPMNDPIDHGFAVHWSFHRHHHLESTPPERVELASLWFTV